MKSSVEWTSPYKAGTTVCSCEAQEGYLNLIDEFACAAAISGIGIV
jgi:hypothetical protein